MLKNIIISNPPELEKIKKKFQEGGAEKLHILSDFERTLTYTFVEREKIPSLISVLRGSGEYLGNDYTKEAQALFDKYHSIEIDTKIPIEEKKKAMEGWWITHFNLLIKLGINKKHLEKVAESGKLKLRNGVEEFFGFLQKQEIPLVIISASGVGEAIPIFLEKEGKLSPNVYIITNLFSWDENGVAVGFKKPIIHSLNKDETMLKDFPFYGKIKERKNVILLGDNIEDIGMIEGFEYTNLIKIGFLNEKMEENLEEYKKTYDVLILNDGPMDYVNDLIEEIIKK